MLEVNLVKPTLGKVLTTNIVRPFSRVSAASTGIAYLLFHLPPPLLVSAPHFHVIALIAQIRST